MNDMRMLGFLVVMLLTGTAIFLTRTVASDPEFVAQLAIHAPWIAEHSVALGWTATVVVTLLGGIIPPVLLMRDADDGGQRLEGLGEATVALGDITLTSAAIYVLLFVGIPGISYLIGMGWFAAKRSSCL